MQTGNTRVRSVRSADSVEIGRLARELGYPASPDEMKQRLKNLIEGTKHHVAVLEMSPEHLLGWVHVERRSSLAGGERAELMGLVVDSSARRNGLGKLLVAEAERWASSQGLTELTVRTNTARQSSHPFYLAMGYLRSKTQHVYVKPLSAHK